MDTSDTLSIQEQIAAAIAAVPKLTPAQLCRELADEIGIDNDEEYQKLCKAFDASGVDLSTYESGAFSRVAHEKMIDEILLQEVGKDDSHRRP